MKKKKEAATISKPIFLSNENDATNFYSFPYNSKILAHLYNSSIFQRVHLRSRIWDRRVSSTTFLHYSFESPPRIHVTLPVLPKTQVRFTSQID